MWQIVLVPEGPVDHAESLKITLAVFMVLDGLAPAHFCNFTLLNLQTSPVLATFKHQHRPAAAALSRVPPYLHHVNS